MVPPCMKLKSYEVLLKENFGNEKRQITVIYGSVEAAKQNQIDQAECVQ